CVVSATVGDLPMDAEIIFNAVSEMAKTGVDFVKIGFFPDGDWLAIVQKLAELAQHTKLIAVLFADTQPDFAIIPGLKKSNFAGVMLDTMHKQKGSLTQVMANETIAEFVELSKTQQLICGLAGSLRLENIAALLLFEADYLGFRGALCAENNRTEQLDTNALQMIRSAIR
ncbi:MAG: (5-formylfuran-3-yl)methyl phosphate synthase, partial [Methylococcales bacterium]|nr:(5-formylfuran-3-yl)methyl phosphate synthase [Methylococcales bacterium]